MQNYCNVKVFLKTLMFSGINQLNVINWQWANFKGRDTLSRRPSVSICRAGLFGVLALVGLTSVALCSIHHVGVIGASENYDRKQVSAHELKGT